MYAPAEHVPMRCTEHPRAGDGQDDATAFSSSKYLRSTSGFLSSSTIPCPFAAFNVLPRCVGLGRWMGFVQDTCLNGVTRQISGQDFEQDDLPPSTPLHFPGRPIACFIILTTAHLPNRDGSATAVLAR